MQSSIEQITAHLSPGHSIQVGYNAVLCPGLDLILKSYGSLELFRAITLWWLHNLVPANAVIGRANNKEANKEFEHQGTLNRNSTML